MAKRHYVTTPIYYVNGAPHIGTALTTVVCDFERRYRAMRDEPAWFLTGTDENATKVVEAAVAAGKETMPFVDEMADRFRQEWAYLGIAYDDFIRTTEPRHAAAVQRIFEILRDNGYVYLDTYEGWYDVSAETFVRDADVKDGLSPDGNPVRKVSEENWFFKLSAFGDKLLAHIESNPTFLLPETRKNEVVSFVKQGLRDMCITRKNPGWGIPVPGDPDRVVYVWFDALINYLAATGWPEPGWEELWPADVHWMGKEIFTRFHATLWPAMLMGAGLPLPTTVIAHGWFTYSGEKISKSKGGGMITPMELAASLVESAGCTEEVAIEAVRYALAAFLPYEGDKDFSVEEVERRYNSDLANDLGNALNRSLAMTHKFVEGIVPAAVVEESALSQSLAAKSEVESLVAALRWDEAVDRTIGLVRFLNKYIDDRAPWALAKAEDPALGGVLRSMLHCVRTAEGLIRPIMPKAADAIAEQLGLAPLARWADIADPNSVPTGTRVGQPTPLFPRIDIKKSQPIKPAKPAMEPTKPAQPTPPAPVIEANEITIDDFARVQLRVARVLEAEAIEGSDKLLKLQVLIGDERRQLVAGIKTSYEPIDLVGRQVVVVYNLKPAKLRGVESQGMVLAATDDDGAAILLQPDRETPEGAKVK